ncbi:endoglucanase A-like [Mercenaria mercenaria]|uniref:endoglucanase A-like n=1 Tax=Mercenaria mercenaria TaxID=6596 RepID=UPI00234E4457|nr:endoglucanase A-like [Mercenaria mercenaria]XP_045161148.2 endoglucanase A-like [Mercenaria mercenaria]
MNILVVLISLCGWAAGYTIQLTEVQDSPGSLQGTLEIPITEVTNGWKIVLTFTGPISNIDIWAGTVFATSDDMTTFTVVNRVDNGVMHVGSKLDVNMFVNFTGSAAPTAMAEFSNLGHDPFTPVTATPNTDGTKYNLNEVLEKSILFYEAQRSGKLPATNRIPWRGDSALQDRGDNGEDLTGGWYDAGDHVKFNFPQAGAVTMLAWGLLAFKDAYEGANQLQHMYDCIRWPLDYLMKCHVSPNEFYIQVGDGTADHNFWGRPENMTMSRPAFKIDEQHPGSDMAAETAAAFAASYLIFKNEDPSYASKLLRHAKELYAFAENHRGKYSESVPETGPFYGSGDEIDEMSWGGAWMYMATNEAHYLQTAESVYKGGVAWGQSWGSKFPGSMVLLYNLTKKAVYLKDIEATFADWLPNGSVPYTPKGLAFRNKWGSLRHTANMAFIAIMASLENIHPTEYRQWAASQINYMLGDGGRSYVVGFGNNPPTHPHHRASSCPMWPAPCSDFNLNADAPNPHVLYGGLVGGPGINDDYTDVRTDYVRNEVAVDYNAGFQSAVAGLKALYMRGAMS